MSGQKHLVFIVNPRSGTDRVKAIQNAITAGLDYRLFSHELQYTQYARHGAELAREAAGKGAYGVVAVGGDGSVNDVVAGLLGTEAVLGIIPKGSGNGMARTMGIPVNNEPGAIAVLNKDQAVAVDAAYANGRPFISNAGAGFDALIAREFAASARRGLLIYSWLVTKHLWQFREHLIDISIDGEKIQEHAFMVNVANGQQFGYNFKIAEDASYTDGLLDVIVIRRFPKMMGSTLVWRALRGKLSGSPYVKRYTGREISIVHPGLQLMQIDGDAHPCEGRMDIRVAPGALRVLVP